MDAGILETVLVYVGRGWEKTPQFSVFCGVFMQTRGLILPVSGRVQNLDLHVCKHGQIPEIIFGHIDVTVVNRSCLMQLRRFTLARVPARGNGKLITQMFLPAVDLKLPVDYDHVGQNVGACGKLRGAAASPASPAKPASPLACP